MLESLFIVALVFLVYCRTFNFGIIVDDMRRHEGIKKGDLEAGKIWRRIEKRLYGFGTLAYKNKDGKWTVNYVHDRILTTSLYALICVLVYWAFGHNQISLLAAVLCALNPANNQVSLWANGRRYAINIILVLLMVLIGPWGLFLYPLTAIFQVTALLSPIIYGPGALVALLPILYLSWPDLKGKIKARMDVLHNSDMRDFTLKKLIPITKVFGLYMKKMVFPGRTMMIYPDLFYWGMTEKGNKDAYSFNASFYFGLTCFVASLAVAVVLIKSSMLWLWVFTILAVLQWSGFLTITQVYADRYIALPSVFMSFFVAYFAMTYLGAYGLPVLALLAGYYWANLQVTQLMYKDIIAFWAYHEFFDRGGPKIREFKATNMIQVGDPLAAWETAKEGLKVNPDDFKLNLIASNCMHIMGDKESCLFYLRKARMNRYIGQDNVIKSFQRGIFGIDIDEEMSQIRAGTSKMPAEQRKNLKDIFDCLEGVVEKRPFPQVQLSKRPKPTGAK
jgi:hypothetical protein